MVPSSGGAWREDAPSTTSQRTGANRGWEYSVSIKSEGTDSKRGISRRTVVAGTAWAVPAIVVASAAPAMAASGPVVLTGRACKDPGSGQGDKSYYFEVTLTNTTNATATYGFTSIEINGVTTTLTPASTTVPANQSKTIILKATLLPNSANGTATLSYTVNGVAGTTQANFNGFPVIGTPQCPLPPPA
jgi:hypothetical protein